MLIDSSDFAILLLDKVFGNVFIIPKIRRSVKQRRTYEKNG